MFQKAFQVILRRITSRAFWVLAICLALLLSKDYVAARTIENVAAKAGVPLHIEHFQINFFNGQVWAKDIRIQSPEGFENEPMIHIDFLFVNLGASTFFRPGIHLKNLVLQLSEIRFVRNPAGEMNLALMKLEGFPLTLDQFEILIDRIVYKDLGTPVSAMERSLEVSIREKHMDVEDLDNLNGLIRIIVLKAARNASFARLLDLNPADLLKDNVFVVLTGARGVGKAASAVTGAVIKPFESAPEEKLEAAVKDAVKGVEKIEKATLEKLELGDAVDEKTRKLEAVQEVVESRVEEAQEIREQTEAAAMILEAKKEAVEELHGEIRELEKTAGDVFIPEEDLAARKEGLAQAKQELEAVKAVVRDAEKKAETAEGAAKEAVKEMEKIEKEVAGQTEALKKNEETLQEIQAAVEERGAVIETLREEVKT